MNNIGSKLLSLRRKKGMTQQEVADSLNLQRATISNYEIGRRKPHITELQRIANFYNASLDYFGVVNTNDIESFLNKAEQVFSLKDIEKERKDEIFKEIMQLYLKN